MHEKLSGCGIEVLLDDRDERAGVKFKDADLLGITAQIIIGKEYLKQNNVELKMRLNQQKTIDKEEVIIAQVKKINDAQG
jgi:prolyl-tRNA synthetase